MKHSRSYSQGKRNGEFAALIALMEAAYLNESAEQANERAGNLALTLGEDVGDYGHGEFHGIKHVFEGLDLRADYVYAKLDA